MQQEDNHVPGEKWEFNEDVAKKFDSMLGRSIPHYQQMRELVFDLGKRFIAEDSWVVDLGASRGESSAMFINDSDIQANFILTEISEPMLKEAKERFENMPSVHVMEYDLRKTAKEIQTQLFSDDRQTTLVLSILTMIFVPVNFRPSIVRGIYKGLEEGGAFFMVEKVLGNTASMQELLVDAYHEYKYNNGYSWESIERKRAALEGVQVPLTHEANIDLLRNAGFTVVETFWRSLNFVGYLAIKDSE